MKIVYNFTLTQSSENKHFKHIWFPITNILNFNVTRQLSMEVFFKN